MTYLLNDLYITSTQGLGLKWDDSNPDSDEDDGRGKSFTGQSISSTADNVNTLRRINPDLVILTEIRYWCAWSSYLPENSLWWQYDNDGNKIAAWQDGDIASFYFLDWNNVEFRKQVAAQCKAVVDTGLVDGIMIDCFTKDGFGDADSDPNRIDLVRRIRDAIGDDYLILVNSAQFINGLYMECLNVSTSNDWKGISNTLHGLKAN